MSPTLTESLRVNAGPDGLRADLAPELSNMPEGAAGGAPFGGLMAALSVRAARAGLDLAAPLKSLTVQFVAGARFEPLDCRPELLRGGRQVSYASIRLGQGGRLATQALATFGQDVEAVSLEALRPVGPPPVDSLPTTTLDPGFAPRFTRYVEHRFDGGPRLFGQNAGGEPVVRCWMRTADRAPLDEDRLCFLLDAVFPVYFTALPPPPALSVTIDLRYDLLGPVTAATSPDGWAWFEFATRDLGGGWAVEDGVAFAPDGRPLALARQRRKLLAPRG